MQGIDRGVKHRVITHGLCGEVKEQLSVRLLKDRNMNFLRPTSSGVSWSGKGLPPQSRITCRQAKHVLGALAKQGHNKENSIIRVMVGYVIFSKTYRRRYCGKRELFRPSLEARCCNIKLYVKSIIHFSVHRL